MVFTKAADPLNLIEVCLFQHKDHTDIHGSTRSSAASFLMHFLIFVLSDLKITECVGSFTNVS